MFSNSQNMDDWIDKGTYMESSAPQGSENWKAIRNKKIDDIPLLTGSNFGNASGVGYETMENLALYMLGVKKREFDLASKKRMDHGIYTEKIARGWYEHVTGNKVKDAGFAIPNFDPRIGSSLDGHVGEDGCVEIKCPESMYMGDKINPSHYAQMQGGMAICNKKWCDYIVYSTKDGFADIKRVEFDKDFWDNDLYPKLCNFIDYVKEVYKIYN